MGVFVVTRSCNARYNPFVNKYISNSEQDTIEFAATWVKSFQIGVRSIVVLLNGDYGVGKTQFVKGLAQGLGIDANITSASYTYIREYPFVLENVHGKLVHVDAWRVKDTEELTQTGILSYLQPENIIVVEWGHKAGGLNLTGKDVQVFDINITESSASEREITINER